MWGEGRGRDSAACVCGAWIILARGGIRNLHFLLDIAGRGFVRGLQGQSGRCDTPWMEMEIWMDRIAGRIISVRKERMLAFFWVRRG